MADMTPTPYRTDEYAFSDFRGILETLRSRKPAPESANGSSRYPRALRAHRRKRPREQPGGLIEPYVTTHMLSVVLLHRRPVLSEMSSVFNKNLGGEFRNHLLHALAGHWQSTDLHERAIDSTPPEPVDRFLYER